MRVKADCTFNLIALFVHDNDVHHVLNERALAEHVQSYLRRHVPVPNTGGAPAFWEVIPRCDSGLDRWSLRLEAEGLSWAQRWHDEETVRKGLPASVVEALDTLNAMTDLRLGQGLW